MYLLKTYINKQNIYDYYVSKYFLVRKFEKIKLLNDAIVGAGNISVLDAWSMLNGDLEQIDGIALDGIDDTNDLDLDTLESFSNLFDQPQIHDNRYVS